MIYMSEILVYVSKNQIFIFITFLSKMTFPDKEKSSFAHKFLLTS